MLRCRSWKRKPLRQSGSRRARSPTQRPKTIPTTKPGREGFWPKDCRVGVAAGLTLARIEGRSGNPDGQKENLTRVLQTAHSLGLLGYMFEATLDQAEADLRAGRSSAARQEAEQVLGQSSDRGFQQIKVKASELVSRGKVGATIGN